MGEISHIQTPRGFVPILDDLKPMMMIHQEDNPTAMNPRLDDEAAAPMDSSRCEQGERKLKTIMASSWKHHGWQLPMMMAYSTTG